MRRAVAITLALPPLAYGVAALLWGLLVAAMQCDEICRTDSGDWRYTQGAWQWYAMGSLGALTFAAGTLFLAAVIARRPWRAIVCLGVGTAEVVTAMSEFLVNPGSDQDLPLALFWLVSAGVLVSGFLAVLLAGTSNGTVRSPESVARRVVAGTGLCCRRVLPPRRAVDTLRVDCRGADGATPRHGRSLRLHRVGLLARRISA